MRVVIRAALHSVLKRTAIEAIAAIIIGNIILLAFIVLLEL